MYYVCNIVKLSGPLGQIITVNLMDRTNLELGTELHLDCPSVTSWDLVDFKSETSFGFLSPNYTGQCTWGFL